MTKLNMSESSQNLEVKEFVARYAKYFIILIVVLIGVYLMSVFHNYSIQKKSNEAAQIYSKFLNSQNTAKGNDSLLIVKLLQDKYADTEFATEASLLYTKTLVTNDKLNDAIPILNWVINNSRDKGYVDVARLRLANIYIDQKNFDGAMDLLKAKHDPAFDGLYYLSRGDLCVAQDNHDKALDAYKEALDKSAQDSSLVQVIQMRMQVLGQ